ncbi:MAG: hypothetical protein GF418_01445 [Chitinivibrionales bacterium]|nr:hypothetical protein [Chitinivibrionales bacterium]MBD3394267.1 hypothetical protein [Chitinivibrionales bacterium]
MKIESLVQHGYEIFRVQQESDDDTDFSSVEARVAQSLDDGSRKIAISLSINAYPYSKLISVLVRCNKLAEDHGGTLAVVQPNTDFLDIIKRTKLDQVFTVVPAEADLAVA